MMARKIIMVAAAISAAINTSSSRSSSRMATGALLPSKTRRGPTVSSAFDVFRPLLSLSLSCRLEVDHVVECLDGLLADPLLQLPMHRQHGLHPGFALLGRERVDLHFAGFLDVLERLVVLPLGDG